jgi:23S rRNA pseudouridine1911/1915/1917 synthase
LNILETYIVPPLKKPIRLSDLRAGTFSLIVSRKAFTKLIKANLVHVNNNLSTTATPLLGGEIITVFRDQTPSNKPSVKIALDVIYEDEYLAIINKPPGVEVSGNKRYTIANALDKALKRSNQEDALLRPEPIHRLDYPTSGCLLIGKTSTSVMMLNRAFKEKKIDKVYYAITIGKQKASGTIKIPLEGKSCITHFEVIDTVASIKYEALNLVKLIPETGRKHQLRKHLAAIQNPIMGDNQYGTDGNKGMGNGLYLHAYSITFIHPATALTISEHIKLPKKFTRIFKQIRL